MRHFSSVFDVSHLSFLGVECLTSNNGVLFCRTFTRAGDKDKDKDKEDEDFCIIPRR